MIAIYTSAEAAKRLGCSRTTVWRLAIALGLGRRMGGPLILTEAEVEAIGRAKRPGPGNPNFGRPAAKKPARKRSARKRRKAG